MGAKANVAIVIYTMYHHVFKMAQAVKEGIDATGLAVATIYRVAETLPSDVLSKMHAPPPPELPVATADTLVNAQALMFGFPTRFGIMPAQFKALLDSTGQVWQKQALAGKPCGIFFSTASQHGGQEVTVLSSLSFLAHHGLLFVPLGCGHPELFNLKEVVGGSPWGSGTIAAGDGSRQPSAIELDIAKHQGKNFAAIAAKLAT